MEPATLYTLPQHIYIVYWLPHHYASQSPPAVGGGSIQPAGTRVGSKYLAVGGWLHIDIYGLLEFVRCLIGGLATQSVARCAGGDPKHPCHLVAVAARRGSLRGAQDHQGLLPLRGLARRFSGGDLPSSGAACLEVIKQPHSRKPWFEAAPTAQRMQVLEDDTLHLTRTRLTPCWATPEEPTDHVGECSLASSARSISTVLQRSFRYAHALLSKRSARSCTTQPPGLGFSVIRFTVLGSRVWGLGFREGFEFRSDPPGLTTPSRPPRGH